MDNTKEIQPVLQLAIVFEVIPHQEQEKTGNEPENKPRREDDPYVFFLPFDCR